MAADHDLGDQIAVEVDELEILGDAGTIKRLPEPRLARTVDPMGEREVALPLLRKQRQAEGHARLVPREHLPDRGADLVGGHREVEDQQIRALVAVDVLERDRHHLAVDRGETQRFRTGAIRTVVTHAQIAWV